MNKRGVIFLSLLIGPFVWIYTYKKDKLKIWILFTLSLLTFGLTYILVAYPWAVLNAAFRRKVTYEKLRLYEDKSRIGKPIKFLAVWCMVLHTLLIPFFMYILAAGVTYMQLGNVEYAGYKSEYYARAVFWSTVWMVLVGLGIVRLLKRYRKDYLLRNLRRCLYVAVVIVLIAGTSISLFMQQRANTKRALSGATCGMSRMLDTARGSVVPIRTDQGAGTGFAISADGKILTANHVVEGATNIRISFTTGDIPLQVVATSKDSDIALLKSAQPTPVFLPLDTDYKIADDVYAIGWPRNTYGAGSASVSRGIISRIIDDESLKLNGDTTAALELVQTDAALNPGNSGGPLISDCGFVGIVSAGSDAYQLQDYGIVSEQGISYSTSSKTAKQIFGL